jgi:hypothetical protein
MINLLDYLNTIKFNTSLERVFCPSVGISIRSLYLILHLYNNPSKPPKMAYLYSNRMNLRRALINLQLLGIVSTANGDWFLTGKGELIYYSFAEYLTRFNS